jgi:prepilin peptidase CpaA
MPEPILPLVLIGPLLIATILGDLRNLRIPNAYSLIGLAVFAAGVLAWPPQDLISRLIVAVLVFLAGYAGFARGLVGGGDVKILAVLMLFIPVPTLVLFANLLSACLLVGVALVLALRRIPVEPPAGWSGIWGGQGFPMGLSIGMAGLLHPWLIAWLA